MGFFIGDFLGVVAPSAGKISGFSLFVFLQVFNLLPDFFSIRTLSVLVYFTMLSIRPASVLRFLNLFAAKGDTVVYCCKMDTVLY